MADQKDVPPVWRTVLGGIGLALSMAAGATIAGEIARGGMNFFEVIGSLFVATAGLVVGVFVYGVIVHGSLPGDVNV